MPIITLQRRITEAGRIRTGQQVDAGNGKTRPEKLETFRFTSADKRRIEQIAALYGGKVEAWQAPAGAQWEVITGRAEIDVIVPPSDLSFSQSYELWSAGGCQRRCDGVTESITEGPCRCNPEDRECDIHTRLSVMLRDIPGLGVWRLDTQGWYAAQELQGAVEVIAIAAGHGALLPARLRLDQRMVKRPDKNGRTVTRRFAVPVIDIEVSPGQLLPGGQGVPLALAAGVEAPARSPLTPVPASTAPVPSIAEQSKPPEPRPRRANAAAEIPASGRRRAQRSAPEPVEEATFAEIDDDEEPDVAPTTDLATLIRDTAGSSDLAGYATPAHREQLVQALTGVEGRAIAAGIGVLWPDVERTEGGQLRLTAAQAQAVIAAADSLGEAFAARWAELAAQHQEATA